MSDDTQTEAPKKKGKMKLVIGALVLLAVGAGGAYGLFVSGMIGGAAAEASEPDRPALVRKGEDDPYAPPAGKGKKDAGSDPVHGEGGSDYRTAYHRFEGSFTSNLADSPGLIQVELAAATQYDGRVLQWIARHELALRSAILVELAATPEADVYTSEGRTKLQERLAAAINATLEEKEGFGGVDNVYFEAFLIQ